MSPTNHDDTPGRFIKRHDGVPKRTTGYPRTTRDIETDSRVGEPAAITGPDVDKEFQAGQDEERARTEEGLGLYGGSPKTASTIIHGRRTVDWPDPPGWPATTYSGASIVLVRNVEDVANVGVTAAYDVDGAIWIGIPGDLTGTFAKRTEVVAEFPGINLREALRRFIDQGGPSS